MGSSTEKTIEVGLKHEWKGTAFLSLSPLLKTFSSLQLLILYSRALFSLLPLLATLPAKALFCVVSRHVRPEKLVSPVSS